MLLIGDVIQVTTEIENRDMMNKVYVVKYESMDGNIRVKHDDEMILLEKGEFIKLEEEEAMIALFKNLTGHEPEYVLKLEEAQGEIESLEETIKDLEDHNEQLNSELKHYTGGF